jgi:hypothetical protein
MRDKRIWDSIDYTSQLLPRRLKAYGQWIEEMVAEGWNAYFTNFMFNNISGSSTHRFEVMRNEVERVYSTIVSRVERKPTSPRRQDYLPRFIGCEDKPVPKTTKVSLGEVKVNDGSHINGVFLFPLKSRLRKHPIDLIGDNKKYYIPEGGPLLRIHLTPLHFTLTKAVDYTFKAIKRGWVREEDIIILPKALSEVTEVVPVV